MAASHRTLVLGLGNPILGDDGAGWRVVLDASLRAAPGVAEFDTAALGGLALMERLIGYDRAILVDAICTSGGVPGTLYTLTVDALPTLHADAAHDASLRAALELGRRLGAHLPTGITVVGIEAEQILEFCETLSPAVEAAVPAAVERVLALLADGDGHSLT